MLKAGKYRSEERILFFSRFPPSHIVSVLKMPVKADYLRVKYSHEKSRKIHCPVFQRFPFVLDRSDNLSLRNMDAVCCTGMAGLFPNEIAFLPWACCHCITPAYTAFFIDRRNCGRPFQKKKSDNNNPGLIHNPCAAVRDSCKSGNRNRISGPISCSIFRDCKCL